MYFDVGASLISNPRLIFSVFATIILLRGLVLDVPLTYINYSYISYSISVKNIVRPFLSLLNYEFLYWQLEGEGREE